MIDTQKVNVVASVGRKIARTRRKHRYFTRHYADLTQHCRSPVGRGTHKRFDQVDDAWRVQDADAVEANEMTDWTDDSVILVNGEKF